MSEWACTGCGDTDQANRKIRTRAGKSWPGSRCRACTNAGIKRARAKRPEHYRQVEREGEVRRRYGITVEELKALGTLCHLCQRPGTDVDHDHETGNKVRGLLCKPCNRSLGGFYDNPALLRRAATYVEQGGWS